jgi:hypothetical protein
MATRFCQFTQAEFEDFLGVKPDGKPQQKGGFHRINVHRTAEAVYSKFLSKDLCLRIYSTLYGGIAREKGSDAIRLGIVWRPALEEQRKWEESGLLKVDYANPTKPLWPRLIRISDKKVLRTTNWRKSLGERLNNIEDIMPPTCTCNCPCVWIVPTQPSHKWEPFWGCMWGRVCPKANK